MMKIELNGSKSKTEPLYVDTGLWTQILNFATANGWTPSMPTPERGPAEVFGQTGTLTKYDAEGLGRILTGWAATPRDFADRDRVKQLGEWLSRAGDVTICGSLPWDASRRLQGVKRVKLVNCLAKGPILTRSQYYEVLDVARRWGWQPGPAENGDIPPNDLRRSNGFDIHGAVIADRDAEMLAAALGCWRPVITAVVPSDIPSDLKHLAELIAAVREGKHQGTAWLRVLAE